MKLKTLSLIACCVSFALQAEVAHNPIDGIKIGERSSISGTLDNNKAIKEARLYFKSNLSDSFIFVDLDKSGQVLQSSLPAPGPSMEQIDYFFAIKYQDGTFERSDVFGTKVTGEWDENAKATYADVLKVHSELDPSKVTAEDFANYVAYSYEAAKLLGSTGNSVSLSSVGGYSAVLSSSSSGTAVAGGTAATASTSAAAAGGFGGLSMTTIGVGVAVVGVGAVAAGSSSEPDSKDVESAPIIGEGEGESEVTGNDNTDADTGTPLVDLPGLGNVLDTNGYETILPPPSATCGTTIKGSGDVPTTTNISIDMGTNTGAFHMSYFLGNMIADEIVIEHDGVQLFTTTCKASPSGTDTSPVLNLLGAGPNNIEITVTSNCLAQTGTYWEFTPSCP